MGFTHALERLFLGLGLTVIEKVKKIYNKKIKCMAGYQNVRRQEKGVISEGKYTKPASYSSL